MLEDRPYMRHSQFRPYRSATVTLLIINIACFILQEINAVYVRFDVQNYFFLSVGGLGKGYVWQLLTFQFLHAGLLHLFLNCFCIFMFGRSVEEAVGKAHFLKLYFLSGVLGGLFQSLLGYLVPGYFGYPVVGASAGVYGLIAAFTLLNPDGVILAWLLFPIRAKYALMIAAAIALFYILVPVQPGVSHAAHLGGIVGGLAYVHLIIRGHLRLFNWRSLREPPTRRELVKTVSTKKAFWQRPKNTSDDELPPAEFISKQVDPILDKISAHGIQSLTARERQILEAARAKMGKR